MRRAPRGSADHRARHRYPRPHLRASAACHRDGLLLHVQLIASRLTAGRADFIIHFPFVGFSLSTLHLVGHHMCYHRGENRRGWKESLRIAHQGTVQSLKLSPDGLLLASCGDDDAIKVWDLESGELQRTLRRDRPYERLDISEVQGLTDAQRATLRALGALEDGRVARP